MNTRLRVCTLIPMIPSDRRNHTIPIFGKGKGEEREWEWELGRLLSGSSVEKETKESIVEGSSHSRAAGRGFSALLVLSCTSAFMDYDL